MQEDKLLIDRLIEYGQSDFYPFHMPGHKRREITEIQTEQNKKRFTYEFPNPYAIDITEIDGFDNLHHAEGILKDSMEKAAEIYHADQSYYLVNGSTCGILSAICGCTENAGKILMARNCHKAAYHGAILNRLEVEYLYPAYLEKYGISGGISAEDIRTILEKNRMAQEQNTGKTKNNCGKVEKKIQAVLIVSPTYEGIVSDIQTISKIVHEYRIPLIVDEAHGAHFPFVDHGFPKSALDCGADVVIQSLHKTLPSFTQTAILHVKGNLVNRKKLERYLGMFQTSSPSYLFIAAMERCVQFMNADGRAEMKKYEKRLIHFFEQVRNLKLLQVIDHKICEEESVFHWDMSKIVISVKKINELVKDQSYKNDIQKNDVLLEKKYCELKFTGEELSECLREKYHLEMEMTAPEYVIAMTSLMDTEEGLERLAVALKEIDDILYQKCLQAGFQTVYLSHDPIKSKEETELPKTISVMKLAEAMEEESEKLSLFDSIGHISQEFVYLYPPGIPLLAPGELISKEILNQISWYQEMGLSVQGLLDSSLSSIITVAEES